MMTASFPLSELFQSFRRRAAGIALPEWHQTVPSAQADLVSNLTGLAAATSEIVKHERAAAVIERWSTLDSAGQLYLLRLLLSDFGPDVSRLNAAVLEYSKDASITSLSALNGAAEPRRQEVLRRLNSVPGGTAMLVSMREVLLEHLRHVDELRILDDDFCHLFSSWFNQGFLSLQALDWSSPASILEKLIDYEAVHDIAGWDELRRRLAPPDRRCFAFFHPQLNHDPLIFVEVALTQAVPDNIADVLREDRRPLAPGEARTAVFYSISNCQPGLRGISFGSSLIKQVVDRLRRELPNLTTFVTLSPMPGFAGWLQAERMQPQYLAAGHLDILQGIEVPGWHDNPEMAGHLAAALKAAAATYFLRTVRSGNQLPDPVGRFHLGNGARLERINVQADRSPRGQREAHGVMVNYLYELNSLASNHEAFTKRNEVMASPQVLNLLQWKIPESGPVPGIIKFRRKQK